MWGSAGSRGRRPGESRQPNDRRRRDLNQQEPDARDCGTSSLKDHTRFQGVVHVDRIRRGPVALQPRHVVCPATRRPARIEPFHRLGPYWVDNLLSGRLQGRAKSDEMIKSISQTRGQINEQFAPKVARKLERLGFTTRLSVNVRKEAGNRPERKRHRRHRRLRVPGGQQHHCCR